MTCNNMQQHDLTVGHEIVTASTLFIVASGRSIALKPEHKRGAVHDSADQLRIGISDHNLQAQSRLCKGTVLTFPENRTSSVSLRRLGWRDLMAAPELLCWVVELS